VITEAGWQGLYPLHQYGGSWYGYSTRTRSVKESVVWPAVYRKTLNRTVVVTRHVLRGRAGRPGDPGTSQFYVSLEDDLMRMLAVSVLLH